MSIFAGVSACASASDTPGGSAGGARGSGNDDSIEAGISDSSAQVDDTGLPDTGLEGPVGQTDDAEAQARNSEQTQAYGVYEGGRASARCTPGTYDGSYSGTYQNAIPTVGPVSLTLSQPSPNGEFVLSTTGTWNAQWGLMAGDALAPIISATAMLIGQLDCKSNQFTATAAPNSMYTAVGFPGGTFTLVLDGTYDPASETLSGSFTYTSNAGNGGGTWAATLSD